MLKHAAFTLLAGLVLGGFAPLQAQEKPVAGVPQKGAPGVTESVSKIMERSKAMGRHQYKDADEVYESDRRRPLDWSKMAPNPDSPAVSHWPVSGGKTAAVLSLSPGQKTPQTVGTSFLGVQIGDTVGYVPPDSMGDVGPGQVVVCVNGRIRSFTKTGVADGALNATTDAFFASVGGAGGTTDPRVRYDRLSGRWFIVMITVTSPTNAVMVAVSSGPTITSASSFTFYAFQADPSYFGDYETLGVDANALYIGLNIFNGNSFYNTSAFVVNKADLLNGTLTYTRFGNLLVSSGHPPRTRGPYTPHGVNNDDPAAAEGYFIGTDIGASGTLVLRRITNPGGTPAISGNINLTVPTTASSMGGVPALGSSVNLDDLDSRLFATRMHNGQLMTAHNIEVNASGVASSTGGRDGSRWYQISNLSGAPSLVQSGTLFDSAASNPLSYWIPSCAMSGQGHMALGCSVAGNNDYASVATAGRLSTDPPGTLQPPTVAFASGSTYNIGDSSNPHRWGDYSVMTVDPNDDMTFWTIQAYCNSTDSWGVRVVKLLAPPPASPVGASPASLAPGSTNVNVVIQGASANGSGFFDPGAGFPNHIAAAVNGGGVTVNSIAFNSPTNITLNLTIAANAAAGPRTVTVTNPDGQGATSSSGIFTVGALGQPPAITVPPLAQTIQCGSSAAFSVTATGAGPLSYQWRLDGANVIAATNTALVLTNVHLPNHTVAVVVTNLYGSATNSVLLTVQDTIAPAIVLSGANPIVMELGGAFSDPGAAALDACAGSVSVAVSGTVNTSVVGTNTLFYSAADGSGNTNAITRAVIVRDTTPPAILWSFGTLIVPAGADCSAAMPDVTGTNFILAADLSGAPAVTQNPTNNAALALGTNIVILAAADASGNVSRSTNQMVVLDQSPPVFAIQPRDQTNVAGASASFSAAATACTPLSFQWFFNNSAIGAGTNSMLTVSNLTGLDAGNYFAVATAAGGSATSVVAVLTVTLPSLPVIASAAVATNGAFSLNVQAVAGFTYVLEISADLSTPGAWESVSTNTPLVNGALTFVDSQSPGHQQRFYRIRRLP